MGVDMSGLVVEGGTGVEDGRAGARTGGGLWTTRRLLGWTTGYLRGRGVERARLVAELLLGHVLGVERLRLYMEMDRPAGREELAAYRGLVERAGAHEPVDYLVGGASFYSMWLRVTPDVLVPRPSTEAVVDYVIGHARGREGLDAPRVADIGTGSGAIAIALAKRLTGAWVVGTDVCGRALSVARENARELGVSDRIDWVEGDLLGAVAGRRFDYLVSNPPYISDAEWGDVPANVKGYEPEGALRGGANGLDYLRVLIGEGWRYVEPGGLVVLEIAASQREVVLEMANRVSGLVGALVLEDHEGLPRVLAAGVE